MKRIITMSLTVSAMLFLAGCAERIAARDTGGTSFAPASEAGGSAVGGAAGVGFFLN